MLFEIKKAKLVKVTDVTNGTSKSGNAWTKATAILEKVEGSYTDTYPLILFGDKIQETEPFVGKEVDVKFNIQPREYNGRWYIDLGLRFISEAETEHPKEQPTPAPVPAKDDDPDGDLPF